MRRIYGLRTVRLPPRLPVRRERLPDRVFATSAERWDAVVARVRALHAARRPVLVGTQSVASSLHVSRRLSAAGLPHALLNALEDGAEAEVLARAGEPGRITVATNMAGRGADVLLPPGVAELGGLHVVVAERGEARRIDRQLVGRCARQGQPGSCERMASLEDALVARHVPRVLRRELARALARPAAWSAEGARWVACRVVDHAQRAEERRHARLRHDLLGLEEELDRALAFSGKRE